MMRRQRFQGGWLVYTALLAVWLVASTLVGQEEGTPGLTALERSEILIEVETPEGFKPLDFSIVPTLAPTIRIIIPSDIPFTGFKILLDDTDPDTESVDITHLFVMGDPELRPLILAARNVRVPIDSNTITIGVSSNQQVILHSASMLNYDANISVVSSRMQFDVYTNPQTGLQFESNIILLNFREAVPFETSSPTLTAPITPNARNAAMSVNDFLRQEKLRPLDLTVNSTLLRVYITTGEDPFVLAERLANHRLLEGAFPNILLQPGIVAGESLPTRLRSTYRATAGPGCTAGASLFGCFDHNNSDDDGDGRDDDDELRIFRQHFLMDTFAAHRLIDVIRNQLGAAWRTQTAGLAIIDSGLGDGVVPGGANPNTVADVPLVDIFEIAQGDAANPFNFDNQGRQVNAGGGLANLTLADIRDPDARILVVREFKTGTVGGRPRILGYEDPLGLARSDACGPLQAPRTVTRKTHGATPRISLM